MAAVTSIVVAGLGGQGVITASSILADAAFRAGHDVKTSEIHGMSQRGGSVTSDIRFGPAVLSPTVSPGTADFLVVLDPSQFENNRLRLRPGGRVVAPELIPADALGPRRTLNLALLGALSRWLPTIAGDTWREAIEGRLAGSMREQNLRAFELGRSLAEPRAGTRS